MKLSDNQKQQLLGLYSSASDSFFTFLNNSDNEKKMEKLENAKKSYAFYSYDEEPLFLLDDTFFGGADDGVVITSKAIYMKKAFEDPQVFHIKDIDECSYVSGQKVSIDYTEIDMVYLEHIEYSFVNIINKLREFHKINIIKEKNLDLYLSITIPHALAISGGKYKDTASGYTIPISKGIQNGVVLSWDGHGKSYGDIKGKLTVTVYIEQPKPKPEPISQPKIEVKNEYKKIKVNCINCGKKHENPTSDDCAFCGKSLTKIEKKKLKKQDITLKQQIHNDNDVDVDELELIVTCVNCAKDIRNYSSHICPHCKEDANINKNSFDISGKKIHLEKINSLFKGLLIKKEKKVLEKTSSASEFYLKIDNDAVVKDIKELFYQQTGLIMRVYESSRKQARGNKKLINLATKEISIRITTRMKIETIIDKFQEVGVKIRIASFDDGKFCNSNFTLAKAKEKYGV